MFGSHLTAFTVTVLECLGNGLFLEAQDQLGGGGSGYVVFIFRPSA